jgi:hypothetical protein
LHSEKRRGLEDHLDAALRLGRVVTGTQAASRWSAQYPVAAPLREERTSRVLGAQPRNDAKVKVAEPAHSFLFVAVTFASADAAVCADRVRPSWHCSVQRDGSAWDQSAAAPGHQSELRKLRPPRRQQILPRLRDHGRFGDKRT